MKTWLKSIVAIALMTLLFSVTEWRQVLSLVFKSSPAMVIIGILLSVFGLVLSAHRWKILLRAFNSSPPLGLTVKLYWVGSFFSNFLPTNIGGDIARAVLTKPLCPLAQAAASILVERLTGLSILLILAAIGIFYRPDYFAVPGVRLLIWACILGMAAVIVLITTMGNRIASILNQYLNRSDSILTKALKKIQKLVSSVNYYHGRPELVLLALLLAIPFYVSVVAFQFVIIAAVGANLGWVEVLFIAPLIPLVSLIPASINSIGIAEGAFVVLYTQAGLTPEQALAAALLRRFILLIVSLFGGILWVFIRQHPLEAT